MPVYLGKGTHSAVNKAQEYMRKCEKEYGHYWILKCDIKKFFYNIQPSILYNILHKYIADPDLLEFTKLLIFDSRIDKSVGIPIGNYTSQFFANIYLNEFDQYIKRTLKVKYYIRYMDDFILFLQEKEDCIILKDLIESFLAEHLKLELNNKSRYFPHTMGINFCGYRIFSTHKLLRTSSKKRFKRKIKIWNELYKEKNLNIPLALQSVNSWLGHVMHCNSYKLKNHMLDSINFIYTNHTDLEIEKNLLKYISNFK